jgi:HSP20 family protein
MTRLYLSPWRELDELTRHISRNVFNPGPSGVDARGAWSPRVSIEETPEELLLTAELPGVAAEDVELKVENNVLTIRGHKRDERKTEERNVHVWERSYGEFTRAFRLPQTVKADAISADLENGLLRVRLPKAPEAKSRSVPVTAKGAEAKAK